MPALRRELARIIAVLALLAFGLWVGGHPRDLPSFLRKAFVAEEASRPFNEALNIVSQDYYRTVPEGKLVHASIGGMLASLHDPYTTYLPPQAFKSFDQPATFTGIGVSVKGVSEGLQVVSVFHSSPAAKAGLKANDVIVKVNGSPLAHLDLSKAVKLIQGAPGTSVQLEVLRNGQRRELAITREQISRPIVASKLDVVKAIKLGWVYLAEFTEGAHVQLSNAVHSLLSKGAKGIVLDLRANPGGLVSEAQQIASLFVRSGVIVTTKGRAVSTVVLKALGGAIPRSIPLVVLVDKDTASAAEIVTAALQDHGRATIVGVHTFGKGVFQELEPLSNGGGVKLTVGEYFTPNGRNLGGGGVKEGAGVTPEVIVKHGVDTDHGLEAALHTLAAKVG